MYHHVRSLHGGADSFRIADISVHHADLVITVPVSEGGEIDVRHSVPPGEEISDEVNSEKPRSPGNQNPGLFVYGHMAALLYKGKFEGKREKQNVR